MNGAVVKDAILEAEPVMVAHGHGTRPQFTVAVESDEGDGVYTLADMDLFMPGVWTVYIRIETSMARTPLNSLQLGRLMPNERPNVHQFC